MVAEAGSGIRHMSDSWIAFQPAIEEPSNIMPSAKVSSSIIVMSKVTCCHLPRGSVKRRSAYLTSFSLINFITSLGVVIERMPLVLRPVARRVRAGAPDRSRGRKPPGRVGSDRVQAGFSGPNPDGFL